MNTPLVNPNIPPFEEEESIDIKKWIYKIISNWYYFAISIFILGVGCYYLNRTIDPLYRSSTTVLIEEVKQRSMLGAQSVMQDFGVGAYRNVNNQIVLLSSYSMVKEAIEKLPLEFEYHYNVKFREYPYYKNAPINVELIEAQGYIDDINFSVRSINEQQYALTVEGDPAFDQENVTMMYGDTIKTDRYKLVVEPSEYFDVNMPRTIFRHRSSENLIAEFSNRMAIDFVMDKATIVEISLTSPNHERDTDFLNTLIQVFLNDNLDRKNREAIRTIDFISTQLYGVADLLAINENSLQDYRSQNNVIDISSQTNIIIQKANQLETQKASLLVKRDYYQYFSDYLQDGEDNALVSPSTIGIEDPILSEYIKQYSNVQFEKQLLAPKDPYHSIAESKLNKIKTSLIETSKNAVYNTNLAISDINTQLEHVQQQSKLLPSKERQLLGIQRELTVNDAYYTYLLQKRSEAQIQKASNAPDNMLIDIARTTGRTNRKKTRLNYIIALMLGAGFPLLVLILSEVLNTKIRNRSDIESITTFPILGSITHKKSSSKIITISSPRSTFTEAFRALRTRLNLIKKEDTALCTMVTSALPGEGKTFITINLAGIFALAGKKTIIVSYDLRKPKTAEYLDVKNSIGLSNYLAGQKSIDDIITNYDTNLDVIYSGTIPPNPGELAADANRNELLFKELRTRYDHIIVDSTPISIVADAFLIGQHVDSTLIIARHNYTQKEVLEETLKQLKSNDIKNIGIIANNISVNESTYRYGRRMRNNRGRYRRSDGYGGGYYNAEDGYTED